LGSESTAVAAMATVAAGYHSAERDQRQERQRSAPHGRCRAGSQRPNPLLNKQLAEHCFLPGSGVAPPGVPRAIVPESFHAPGCRKALYEGAAVPTADAKSASQPSDQAAKHRPSSRSSSGQRAPTRTPSGSLSAVSEGDHLYPPTDSAFARSAREEREQYTSGEEDLTYADEGSRAIWRALNEELLHLGQRCERAESNLRQRTADLKALHVELEHSSAERSALRMQLQALQKQRHGAMLKIHADRDALDHRCKKAETHLAHRTSELFTLQKELAHSNAVRSALCAELASLKDQGQCVICLSEVASHVVIPCGHQALCKACAMQDLESCPVCRQPVHAVIRVYRP